MFYIHNSVYIGSRIYKSDLKFNVMTNPMKTIQLANAERLEGEGYILYRMLNPTTVGSKKFMSFVVEVHSGGEIPEHTHGPAEVGLHILDGRASVIVDGQEELIKPGTAIHVPIGSTIGLNNVGDEVLRFVAVLSPPIDVSVCQVCGIETKAVE
jgi:quercetin dioxygenase-like cupin family protein